MATVFERDGSSWADQWDNHPVEDHRPREASDPKKEGKEKKLGAYNKKIKSAASSGLGKAKVVASDGAKKVKSGTVVGIRWIKSQYRKRTQK